MGCWCETCGITQLPINAGDKVRLFVLVAQDDYRFHEGGAGGGGTCYATDRWSPIGPAIQGEYDDYGGVENIVENEDSKMIFNILKEGWVNPKSEHEWDKVPAAKDLSLSDMLAYIERDRGKIKTIGRGTRHLGAMMVLEDVYQAMVKFNPIEAHHMVRYHYKYKPALDILRHDLKEWYDSTVEICKSQAETAKSKKPADKKLQELYDRVMDLDLGKFFGFREDGNKAFKPVLQALAKEGLPFDHERVQRVAQSALDFTNFSRGMYLARKQWIPQSGKGGQNNDLDIYSAINQATSKIIAEREKQHEEDGGEKRDENGYYPYQIEHNLEEDKNAQKGK